MLNRRSLILLPLAAHLAPALALPRAAEQALLQGAQLRVGIERLAKLSLERQLLPERAALELPKERLRVMGAMERLNDKQLRPTGLSGRRLAQLERALEGAAQFVGQLDATPLHLLTESEALAARLGFITTALSGELEDPARGAWVDLLARASASALRVGKLNFAAASALDRSAQVAVGAQQSLLEFQSALQAMDRGALPERAQQELQLAQHQWLLFRATLRDDGLLKSRERLADLASTTDRIAEALGKTAQRLLA